MADTPGTSVERVECPAAIDPTIRLFIGAVIMLGMGAWCYYEGFVLKAYPYPQVGEDINAYAGWAFNCVGPFLFVPIGLILLVMGMRFRRRVLVADAEGIGFDGGKKTLWSQITELNAAELQSKGFLYLHTSDGKKITLDSWKLQNFRDMVAFVETHVPAERHKI